MLWKNLLQMQLLYNDGQFLTASGTTCTSRFLHHSINLSGQQFRSERIQ